MSRNGHPGGGVVERAIPDWPKLPRPLLVRAESLPAGSLARAHAHPWVQLSWARSGVLQVATATARYLAPPQRAIWIPAGVGHEVRTSGRAEMRSLYLASKLLSRGERCQVLTISPLVRELIVAAGGFAADYDEAGPEGRLVAVLLDALAAAPEVAFDLPLPRDRRLVLLCDALQADPSDGRSHEQWGRAVGLAGRSIARLFRVETGLSFAEWRLKARLLRAVAQLEAGAPVTRVALDCGYASSSAFIVAFRRQFGATPGAMFGRSTA